MSVDDVKSLYVVSCFLLGLIILSPTITMFVSFSGGEQFSELWLLGEDHIAEGYPFNVRAGEVYRVYLGIGNHMGGSQYYQVFVKFRNQIEPLSDVLNGTPSALGPIFEYRAFLGDGETWEKEVLFSFEDVLFEGNFSSVGRIVIDGYSLDINKFTVWNEPDRGFYYQLFFELWLYNETISDFQFHNRFVGVWFNMIRV